jgi:glycosyltransferase involved in cell wall biosynthesis
MAAGHVVLSTPIGAEGLRITDKKDILIESDPVEFADTIIKFLKGQYDRTSIVNNARKFITDNYTWDIIGDQFIALYENLLKLRST